MRTARAYLVLSILAVTLVLGSAGAYDLTRVQAMASIPVSGDVGRLPHRADIDYAVLPQSAQVRVSADQAVKATEAWLGLSDSQIDQGIGVVRAVVNFKQSGVARYHNETAWVVTADYDIVGPGNGVLYHKVCVVVDAATGEPAYAFTVDPAPRQS